MFKRLSRLSLTSKIALGTTTVYVGYTTYIYALTNYEIEAREERFSNKLITGTASKENSLGDFKEEHELSKTEKFQSLVINGRFENPFKEYRPQTLFEFLAMRVIELFEVGKRGGLPDTVEELRTTLPVYQPDLELLKNNFLGETTSRLLPPLQDRLSFTWFGQSCSLLQLSNVSFLLDPMFEDHLIDDTFGPKRFTPSPIKLDTLLKDAFIPQFVVVSHNHPDHLDNISAKMIGNRSTWIVPVGLRSFLARKGIYNTIEMNWWDRVPIEVPNTKDKYEVICLPCLHWSGRHITDTNKSLWCSFLILKNNESIFFHCGDTGYSNELFKTIGELYKPIKFSALPIGQYCPEWHQKPRHINPQEAIDIMNDLKIHKIAGVHWGTFVLSSENYLEPKLLLEKLADLNSKQNNIFVPKFGKTIVMDMKKLDYSNDDEVEVIRDGRCIVYK